MFFLKKAVPFYKKNTFIILSMFIVLLITVRVFLPSLLLSKLNDSLESFSPELTAHISDLDLAILRGAYSFQKVEVKLKKDNKRFVLIDEVEVSLAMREVLRGKIFMDVVVTGLDFHYLNSLKDIPWKKTDSRAKDKFFPVKLSRLDIKDSKISIDEYPGLSAGEKLFAKNIEGRMTNLTPDKNAPLSFFYLKATLLGSAVFKSAGKANLLTRPPEWDFDSEIQGFDMTTLNAFLVRKVPLTFTKGKLDLYAEAVSEHGKIEGYVKPFIKNLDVIKNKEDFAGPKHWAIEIITAVSNVILRASNPHTVATKVPFSYSKTFKVDVDEAAAKAIEHGFQQQLSPGIENKLEMK